MSPTKHAPSLPSAMAGKLRSIRRRQVLLAILRGTAIGLCVLVVAMVAAMAVDWMLTLFDTRVRTALTTFSLLAAVIALLLTVVPALVAARRWKRAAAVADDTVPELEERWTTVAGFAESGRQPATPTARAMLDQVISEAAVMERLVQPGRIVRPMALRPVALALSGSLLLLVGFLSLHPPQTFVLLQRFWSPRAAITGTSLQSLAADLTVPRGETVELGAVLTGLPRRQAKLDVHHDSGLVDQVQLRADRKQSRRFAHRMRVDGSFRYRLRAGDGQTQWHNVTAVDYPALEEVRFTVTPPEYVDRPAYDKRLIPGRVKVVQGSRLDLQMKPAAELERLELTLSFDREEEEPLRQTIVLEPEADGWYRFGMQLLDDVSLRPALWNKHGLTDESQRQCRMQVIVDRAPVARVVAPTQEQVVAADDVIDIQFEAHDDFGIAAAELVVYDESDRDADGEPRILDVQPIPLGDQRLQRHVRAETRLDLKKYQLTEGTEVSYALRVRDNRNLLVEPDAALAQLANTHLPGELPEATDPPNADRDNEPDAEATAAAGDAGATPAESPVETSQMLTDSDRPADDPSQAPNNNAVDGTQSGQETGEPGVASVEQGSEDPSGKIGANVDDPAEPRPTENKLASNERAKNSQTSGEGTTNAQPVRDPADAVPAEESALGHNDKSRPDGKPQGIDQAGGDNSGAKPGQDRSPSSAGDEAGRSSTDALASSAPPPERPITDAESQQPSDENRERASAPGMVNAAAREETPATTSAEAPQDEPDTNPPASFPGEIALRSQQSESGQNAETKRQSLKIAQRLMAVATSTDPGGPTNELRERIVKIDGMLAEADAGLAHIVDRTIPDADHREQYDRVDQVLADVETAIADLRAETQDQEYAFVGLQMVDLARTHVTPARDRVFAALRDLISAPRHTTDARQHVVRARELLAALLRRYDEVARDRQLADALSEAVEIYEVYVEKRHRLMREARQNRNPLERKMSIIEVDQDYLDRYAEVLALRREMMAEFARMLADDPRLLARYLDRLQRRRASLRDQLGELAERQDELATELSGWLAVSDQQRDNLWKILAEMRLQATTALAADAAELAERIQKQMPLILEPSEGTAALVLQHAQQIATLARTISFDAQRIIQQASLHEQKGRLTTNADRLVWELAELDAALDRLNFEHEADPDVTGYVSSRLLDSRAVADLADAWALAARHLERQEYHGLIGIDQQRTAIATELLRVAMLDFEDDLEAEFQQVAESSVPADIVELIRQLHRVMEDVTFHQAGTLFAISGNTLPSAQRRQALAVADFERAEELFDRIRRAVTAALDEYDEENPTIADLEDPTLDEFLARLEREPDIQAQLGIPNRPRNLRVQADVMDTPENRGDMLADSQQAARSRASDALVMHRKRPETPPAERPDQDPEQREQERQMQQALEKSLLALQKKIEDPRTPQEQKTKLQQMAENLQQMLGQIEQPTADAGQWKRIARSDQAQAVLSALASGEEIPDEQWNRLLSTLDDGLWQVRGRTPPEDYRRAIEQYQDQIRQLMDTIVEDAQ